jgi:hypothetical protein
VSIEISPCFALRQRLGGAILFRLLGLRGSWRFLDRVCSLSLLALTFQPQGDKMPFELAVVHDSSFRVRGLHSCMLRGFIGLPQNFKKEFEMGIPYRPSNPPRGEWRAAEKASFHFLSAACLMAHDSPPNHCRTPHLLHPAKNRKKYGLSHLGVGI